MLGGAVFAEKDISVSDAPDLAFAAWRQAISRPFPNAEGRRKPPAALAVRSGFGMKYRKNNENAAFRKESGVFDCSDEGNVSECGFSGEKAVSFAWSG